AADLAFTIEETATRLCDAGPERSDSECEVVCRVLGGGPTLVSAAAAVARSRPQRLIDSRGLPTPALARLVRPGGESRLDELVD
ncbi:hypothetical protein NVV99_26665, partial [Rhodococcus sp. PAE-6]|uniref:hypothetical protein n=1 Tax=Rhodococcus sp. PAE-6 TaxID=2972477 RepID=UPI0021B17CD3